MFHFQKSLIALLSKINHQQVDLSIVLETTDIFLKLPKLLLPYNQFSTTYNEVIPFKLKKNCINVRIKCQKL